MIYDLIELRIVTKTSEIALISNEDTDLNTKKDHSDVPICLNFIKLDCRVQIYI